MWKHLRLQVVHVVRGKKVQEGGSMVWGFWYRPVYILGLTPEQTSVETIWQKYEEFWKPQTNEIRARFDLLTSFQQGEHSAEEWYNAVQSQINLARYPQETARILQRDIFWFFLKDEDFVLKIINDFNIDFDKFPASKVRQLAKKLESSKSTAKHIKQVSHEPQAATVTLLRHQCTKLP